MALLTEIRSAPDVRDLLEELVDGEAGRTVRSVRLVDDLTALDRAEPDAVVLLGPELSGGAASYRFDVAVRLARARRVAALVLTGPHSGEVNATSVAIARRGRLAVLRAAPDVDLGALAIAIAREIAGDAGAALLRAHAAMKAVGRLPPDAEPAKFLAAAGEAIGVEPRREEAPGDGLAAAIRGPMGVAEWVCLPPAEGNTRLAHELVLRLTAAAVAQSEALARRAEELPIQSRAEVLTELLDAPTHGTARLLARARDLDLPVDGWHVAVRLEREEVAEGGDEAYEVRQAITRLALQTVRSSGGVWHSARSGSASVLVRMWREDPGGGAVSEVIEAANRAIERARRHFPGSTFRCGVGSLYDGPTGLVSSAAEARAAIVATQPGHRVNVAVPFDSVGLRRALVEWYSSETVRETVQSVLEPLIRLGGTKSQTAIETLQAYLDNQGSLTRTAEALHLHRNAVAYRIKRIFSQLDADPDNPDDRLLLQLACRAQGLTWAG